MAEAFRKEVLEIENKLSAEQQQEAGGQNGVLRQMAAHDAAVRALAVGGGTLCTGSEDCLVKQFDLATNELVNSFAGHRDWITSICMRGGVLYTGSADNTARSW